MSTSTTLPTIWAPQRLPWRWSPKRRTPEGTGGLAAARREEPSG
jgi:hypothetical protein